MTAATHGPHRWRLSNRRFLCDPDAHCSRPPAARRVYFEKASGAKSDWPQLARLLKAVDIGDVVIVTRLDRLARSTRDLLNIVHQLNEAGAAFKSLAETWADTTSPHGKLILTVLAGMAEFERALIMARTQAGITKARELGKTFGRPPRLNARQKRMIAERLCEGRDDGRSSGGIRCRRSDGVAGAPPRQRGNLKPSLVGSITP